jgi:heat shock protein HslJ
VARAAGLGLALALATGATLLTGTAAQAQGVDTGSFSFGGDDGDWISGGQSYSYSTSAKDAITVTASPDDNYVHVSVEGANSDWWDLNIQAPAGQALAPGEYTGATRYPFNAPTVPGLDLTGNGRGCNTSTGSFTIDNVVFGPDGYVQTLDATYEQHCEGGTSAARGEVHIANPAPPAQLDLGLDVAVTGTAGKLNGKAAVSGTVSCNVPTKVAVAGQVTQVKKKVLIKGSYSTSVACTPGAPVAWSAQADPSGTTPFQKGDVEVVANATANDPTYGTPVTVSRTVVTHLTAVSGTIA